MNTNSMVAGFLFSENRKKVVMICKRRPPWQFGRLNGVGGHVEAGETPETAMYREFREETGALLAPGDWKSFCVISGRDFRVECFKAFRDRIIESMTDERVLWLPVSDLLSRKDVIPNVRWLLLLALDKDVTATVDDPS